MSDLVTFIGTPEAGEGCSYQILGNLLKEDGSPLGSGDLTTLTLTLTDVETGAVINSVSAVNVLNADRGTVDAGGLLTISLTVADAAFVTSTKQTERHQARVDWTYGAGGAKAGWHEVRFFLVKK